MNKQELKQRYQFYLQKELSKSGVASPFKIAYEFAKAELTEFERMYSDDQESKFKEITSELELSSSKKMMEFVILFDSKYPSMPVTINENVIADFRAIISKYSEAYEKL